MNRSLIVSPRFPPINAPDLHRVRHSLPYFHRTGWESVLAKAPSWRRIPTGNAASVRAC